MLIIREKQIFEMHEQWRETNVTKIIQRLACAASEQDFFLGTSNFRKLVQDAIDGAGLLKLTDEMCIFWFVYFSIFIHPQFYRHPSVGLAFTDEATNINTKFLNLIRGSKIEFWNELSIQCWRGPLKQGA